MPEWNFDLFFLLSFYFAAQSSGQCRQHLDLSKQTSLKAESYYPTYYGFYKEGRADVNAGQSECSHTTTCLRKGFWANEAQSGRRSRNTRDGGMAFFCAFPVARVSRFLLTSRLPSLSCFNQHRKYMKSARCNTMRAEQSPLLFSSCFLPWSRMRQNRTSKGKVLEALGWGALRVIRARAGAGARFPHAGALTFYSSPYLYFTCTSFLV